MKTKIPNTYTTEEQKLQFLGALKRMLIVKHNTTTDLQERKRIVAVLTEDVGIDLANMRKSMAATREYDEIKAHEKVLNINKRDVKRDVNTEVDRLLR